MPTAFHLIERQTSFRCPDAHQQSRSFARWNQSLRRSQTPTGFAKVISDYAIPTADHALKA
jgi:hypothetical protein